MAYRAYNNTSMLGLANTVWSLASVYVITASDAAAGSHSTKSHKFSAKCNGGVYPAACFTAPELI